MLGTSAPRALACPSGIYRSTGRPDDLDAHSPPLCVTVFDAAHDGDDIVEFAIDNYSGSDRVYTLYDDGTISVGASTNLASIKAPKSYALPDNVPATKVYSFALFNGVAVFHADGYRVLRDVNFRQMLSAQIRGPFRPVQPGPDRAPGDRIDGARLITPPPRGAAAAVDSGRKQRVTAINACGESVPSNVIAFSSPIPQLRPAAR